MSSRLRNLRSKLPTGLDPLQLAISTTTSVKNLLSTLSPSPVTAPFSAVLLTLEAIQDIRTNQANCIAIAWRAAQILVDIDRRMHWRWDSAPEHLVQSLQKFEGILELIHKLMKNLAGLKGSEQFLRDNSVEHVLAEYSRLLDEAAHSLQLATLIDLPDTVDTLSRINTERTPRSRL